MAKATVWGVSDFSPSLLSLKRGKRKRPESSHQPFKKKTSKYTASIEAGRLLPTEDQASQSKSYVQTKTTLVQKIPA